MTGVICLNFDQLVFFIRVNLCKPRLNDSDGQAEPIHLYLIVFIRVIRVIRGPLLFIAAGNQSVFNCIYLTAARQVHVTNGCCQIILHAVLLVRKYQFRDC